MILSIAGALAWVVATAPSTPPLQAQASPCCGHLETFRIAGAQVADSVTVQVYRPAGYTTARRYPTIYAFHPIHDYFRDLRLDVVLDSAVAAGMPPVLAVSLPIPGEAERMHLGTPELDRWQRFVLEQVIPSVEARYAAEQRPDARHLLAFSAGANVILDLAVGQPARFGRVAAQSPGWMVWDPERQVVSAVHVDDAVRKIAAAKSDAWPRFWFVWGDAPEGWEADSRAHGARVLEALRARGASVSDPVLVPGNHNLGLVSASLPLALRFLTASVR